MTTNRIKYVPGCLLAITLITACAGDDMLHETTEDTAERHGKMVEHSAPKPLIARIVDDFVARSGAQRDQVFIRRAESVTWGDPSLGCPEPGMAYPQVIVDGYWVELEHNGRLHDYRVDGSGNFKLCTQKNRRNPVPGGGAT